ncbi:MAG: response regulator transcription factor [Planctomycetota bacterium]|jgi:DNA-binding response OmpR family regulator
MAYLLIVDDDRAFAQAAAKVLRGAGHEVEVSLEIEAAVSSMHERRPDLVILDVMFPNDRCAGFTLARRISLQDEKLKGIPILMLTAVNSSFPFGFGTDDIDDDWLPVSDFVEKPADLDVLQSKVEALLSKAGSGSGAKK